VCLDSVKTHALEPCMHVCLCDDCAATTPMKRCPLCSEEVTGSVRLKLV
jgi:hypothetical protein